MGYSCFWTASASCFLAYRSGQRHSASSSVMNVKRGAEDAVPGTSFVVTGKSCKHQHAKLERYSSTTSGPR